VAGSEYFTTLNLTSGYYQILISKGDQSKTAYQTPFGHFQYKVLIEGSTNAPTTFQIVMKSSFHPYIRTFVVVYIDDIMIFSKTEDAHQAHVRLVLNVRGKFYVCKVKSIFAQKKINDLGLIHRPSFAIGQLERYRIEQSQRHCTDNMKFIHS
jgi:hypothetical protein